MKTNKRILKVTVERIHDQDPDTSYLEQDEFEERFERFRNGEFGFIGIRATAEIQTAKDSVIQTVTSGGLWGIESDSGEDYLKSVAVEELQDLRNELEAIGFSPDVIQKAIDEAM